MPVADTEHVLQARRQVDQVYLDDKIKHYIVDLVFATREPDRHGLDIGRYIDFGASPRASIYLALAAKAYAFLQGRDYVTPQDVKSIGMDVLRHRVLTTYEAEADGDRRRGSDPEGVRQRRRPLSAPPRMLPAETFRQVRRIHIRTRRLVDGALAGEYHSVFKGRGMEFAEVREYVPGDDVRTIDWNVTARMGQPFVKQYVEERELTVMLLVDLSASGQFGSVTRFKSEIATELCAAARAERDPQQRQGRPDPVHRPHRALHTAAERAQPRAAGDPRHAGVRAGGAGDGHRRRARVPAQGLPAPLGHVPDLGFPGARL